MGALMDGMADVLGRITLGPEDEQTIRSVRRRGLLYIFQR